jgi:hypothetical protein
VSDERALLIAIPLRHLESLSVAADDPVLLPAGGPGDLDAAPAGTPVFVMATDAGEAEVPAATWRATYLGRPAYEPGSPWPSGLPATWVEEHRPDPEPLPDGDARLTAYGNDADDDEDLDGWDDEEDGPGPQAFLSVTGLERLPRDSWLFTNELVRKQARRGRSFRPRVPTLVDLPD